jgi:hypothetical protein
VTKWENVIHMEPHLTPGKACQCECLSCVTDQNDCICQDCICARDVNRGRGD